MGVFNPSETVYEYVSRYRLFEIYWKTGYDKQIDEQSKKLATNIYSLVISHAAYIEKYSKIYQKIAKVLGAGEKEYTHERYDFEDELKKHHMGNSKSARFMNSFFKNIDELEGYYKAGRNPLPDNVKQEVVKDISYLQESFLKGNVSLLKDCAWEFKDRMSFIFSPSNLEEFFGNKKEEFESVIDAIICFQEWRGEEKRERSSNENFVREKLLKAAKLYTESIWMHSPVLTVGFLSSILGTYTISFNDLEDEISNTAGKLLIPIVIFFSIPYFFPSLKITFNIFCGILMLFILYLCYKLRKTEKKFKKLNNVYSEICNEGYDGEEIGRRLHKIEEDGLDIPSIIYSLLKLKHKPSRL